MKRAALFVGVDRYQDPEISDLQCAESDALELYGLCKHKLELDQAEILRGPRALEVIHQVEGLCSRLRPGDLFLFYFAGHGIEHQGDQWLLCPSVMRRHLEDRQDIVALSGIRRMTADRGLSRVLILDACRSNLEAQVRDGGSQGLQIARSLRDLGAAPGTGGGPGRDSLTVLLSCGEGQQARELPERHRGLFTAALLEGLETGIREQRRLEISDQFIADLGGRMDRIAAAAGLSGGQRPARFYEGAVPVLREGGEGAEPAAAPDPIGLRIRELKDEFTWRFAAGELNSPAGACCEHTLGAIQALAPDEPELKTLWQRLGQALEERDQRAYRGAETEATAEAWEAYLAGPPPRRYEQQARERLAKLRTPPKSRSEPPAADGIPRAARPYRMHQQDCWTGADLAAQLNRYWADGVADLKNGLIKPWLQDQLHDQDMVRLLSRLEDQQGLTPDQRLLHLIRHLAPGLPPVWKGWSLALPELTGLARRGHQGDARSRTLMGELWDRGVLTTLAEGGHPALGEVQERWRQALADYNQAWRQLTLGRVPERLRPPLPEALPSLLLGVLDPAFAQELQAQAAQAPEPEAGACPWYPALAELERRSAAQALAAVQLLPAVGPCGRERIAQDQAEAKRKAEQAAAKRREEEQQRREAARQKKKMLAVIGLVVGVIAFGKVKSYLAEQEQAGAAEQLRQEQARELARQEQLAHDPSRQDQVLTEQAANMVPVKGGTFQMGSPPSEKDHRDDERQHAVTVKDFRIGKYEVTQGEWLAVMGSNPSRFRDCGIRCPVEQVSWDQVQDYIAKLNARTGKRYRLPTEAEWEYACRGGREGERHCGGNAIDSLAWYEGNSGQETHPVGQKAANAFGLHDMGGNVGEWTCSAYDKDYGGAESQCDGRNDANGHRSYRGGAWYDGPALVRAAYRDGFTPGFRNFYLGLRLAQD